MSRPPLPPFTLETAMQKVRMAEDAWNTRDPARVALAYTEDSRWRNRAEFIQGRAQIEAFLTRKWQRELDYRGAFRAHLEFDWAVQAIRSRRVDVRPLITAQLPLAQAQAAFELALDRNRSTKVQLVLDDEMYEQGETQ